MFLATPQQVLWTRSGTESSAAADPLKILKGLAFRLVWSLLPLWYAYQFVFILRKAEPGGHA